MKKIVAGMVSVIMILSLSTTIFAGETLTERNSSKQINVRANAVYITPENMYEKPITEDKASVTTEDGTIISIAGSNSSINGLTMNVIEISHDDKDAYSWISNTLNGICEKFNAYDIYFTDKDGKRIDLTDGVVVSITKPDNYANIQVYHVRNNGTYESMDSKLLGENIVFTAVGFGYYVIADSVNAPENPDGADSPETGDSSNMYLWTVLMFIAGCSLMVFKVRKKV